MASFAGNGAMFPRMPMMNGMMGPNNHFPPNPMMPGPGLSGTFSPLHRMPFPENVRWVTLAFRKHRSVSVNKKRLK